MSKKWKEKKKKKKKDKEKRRIDKSKRERENDGRGLRHDDDATGRLPNRAGRRPDRRVAAERPLSLFFPLKLFEILNILGGKVKPFFLIYSSNYAIK